MYVINNVFLYSHLNQHIKAEKHDGGDVSPFSMPTPEFEKTLEVGEVQYILLLWLFKILYSDWLASGP
jgi:hypothetical protein